MGAEEEEVAADKKAGLSPIVPSTDIVVPEKNAEERAGLVSRLLFLWLSPLVSLGYERPLELDDLPELSPLNSCGVCGNEFQTAWTAAQREAEDENQRRAKERAENVREEGKYADEGSPKGGDGGGEDEKPVEASLLRVLWGFIRSGMIESGVIKFLHDILQFTPPLLLGGLLAYLERSDQDPSWTHRDWFGYSCAASLFVVSTVRNVMQNSYFHITYQLSIQTRVRLCDAVYRKALRLSPRARQARTVGEIVNFMQLDTTAIADAIPMCHTLWSGVFQIVGNLVLLGWFLGWVAVIALVLTVAMIPVQKELTMKGMMLRKEVNKHTDTRVKLVNEILQGIKVVKMYAWELPFGRKIREVRAEEMSARLSQQKYSVLMMVNFVAAPIVIALVVIVVYAATGGDMRPSKVFTALAIMNAMRFPMMILPYMLNAVSNAWVSAERVQGYLNSDEIDVDALAVRELEDTAHSIEMRECIFKLEEQAKPGDAKKSESPAAAPAAAPAANDSATKTGGGGTGGKENSADNIGVDTLDATDSQPQVKSFELHIDRLDVDRGSLVSVVGSVGSGKTTLMLGMLNQLPMTGGTSLVTGRVAYCAQEAWIVNATLRDNVLFGRDFDPVLYGKVVYACELERDLQVLPDGDRTEIGERGINLSGGQKQRVALARAAYARADVYLLDDPLSAVDAHVGRNIFERLIKGLLRSESNATVVLITNQLWCVHDSDLCVALAKGKIVEMGPFPKLMADKGVFAKLIQDSGSENTSMSEGHKAGESDGGGALSRMGSMDSRKSMEVRKSVDGRKSLDAGAKEAAEKARAAKGILTEREKLQRGEVEDQVYWRYFFASGGVAMFIIVVLSYLLKECSELGTKLWLAAWTEDWFSEDIMWYLYIYVGISLSAPVFVLAQSWLFYIMCYENSLALHEGILSSVLGAPLGFFDITPVGRILARFSSDILAIDDQLPMSWSQFLRIFFSAITTYIVISVVTPLFLVVALPITMVYMSVQEYYKGTAREIKRLDNLTKSPIFQQFSETLTGLTTIRAFGESSRFVLANERKLNANQKAFYTIKCCDRWLSLRLEFLGDLMVGMACVLCIVGHGQGSISPGLAGLSISYALSITSTLAFAVRSKTETEAMMNAVERNIEYTDHVAQEEASEMRLPPTADAQACATLADAHVDAAWPQEGGVHFKGLGMRYRPELDLVLKGIDVNVMPREKVGVVGRTGSGKSSMMLSLFRLVEAAEGAIIIDGVDIARIPLYVLRNRMSIIPQDPVVFSGTVRLNLDPFGEHSDEQLWSALRKSHLEARILNCEGKLEEPVVEYGANFSVGERQLLCLARCVLRGTKILVMDEATSSVDFETDSLIQQTVRTEFKDCTILTIAHRIHTIIDCDRVLVLENGVVADYDSPKNLLDREGIFKTLVANTGAQSAAHLKAIADGKEDFLAVYKELAEAAVVAEDDDDV